MLSSGTVQRAQAYWDVAARTYEAEFLDTPIGQLMRSRIWRELDRTFFRGARILELNCGTGADALHLAERKVHVTACDISPGMIERARQRALTLRADRRPEFHILPTEHLCELAGEFDGAFSNFAGLNCVRDLRVVSRELARLLQPGASFLACMLGRFVPWEIVWYFAHGDARKALRRLVPGARENVDGPDGVEVRYYSRRQIVSAFEPEFWLHDWRGIGISLPPTYAQQWARRFPSVPLLLTGIDELLGTVPLFRSAAGFMLLHFRRL